MKVKRSGTLVYELRGHTLTVEIMGDGSRVLTCHERPELSGRYADPVAALAVVEKFEQLASATNTEGA